MTDTLAVLSDYENVKAQKYEIIDSQTDLFEHTSKMTISWHNSDPPDDCVPVPGDELNATCACENADESKNVTISYTKNVGWETPTLVCKSTCLILSKHFQGVLIY